MEPTLVITHATPARALRAYFLNKSPERCMANVHGHSEVPRALAGYDHCVIELNATVGGGYTETIHRLPPPRPQSPNDDGHWSTHKPAEAAKRQTWYTPRRSSSLADHPGDRDG